MQTRQTPSPYCYSEEPGAQPFPSPRTHLPFTPRTSDWRAAKPETLCSYGVAVEEIHKLLEGVGYTIGVVGIANPFLLAASEIFLLRTEVALWK